MAFASSALIYMQTQACDHNPELASAVNSGLVGVTTNPNNNSYHHSKNSAPFKNVGAYTNRWWNDLVQNHPSINRDAVCGFDQSMNRADMIKATQAFKRVFDDPSDPRRKYFAEIIGTLNGTTAVRMDFGDGSLDAASADHTWHLHGAWWYLFWGAMEAAHATLSVLRMETKAQYITATGGSDAGNSEGEVLNMRLIVANWQGKASVFSGLRGVVPLMAHGQEEAVKGLVHAGADRQTYVSAEAMVEAMGTFEGKTVAETVQAIKGMG